MYSKYKRAPELAEGADDSMGSRVRLILRAGALPVRAVRCIEWSEGEKECPCGEGDETVDHFLLTCPRVSGVRDPYVDSGG